MNQAAAMSGVVRVRAGLLRDLVAEARRDPRIECCGLLAGRDGIISTVLPVRNVLASATAYEIAPDVLFALFRRMREEKLDHLGIYHSHPATHNVPSPTDIERAYYPDVAYFIVSPRAGAEKPVRAFLIAEGRATELAIDEV
jgi:proteasome lid subunit RPN8/RPN11